MKKFCFGIFLVIVFALSGCTLIKEPSFSATASFDSQEISSKSENSSLDMERNNVVDLPNELYQVDHSAYADLLRYDFSIEEKMQFTIITEVIAGNFSLGIEDRNSKDYVYDMKEFQSETDSVTLEKGKYSIETRKSEFTGSYSIKGTPAK